MLDLGLPDVDGLEVTRRLREWTKAPIIVISARGQESDKVAALDMPDGLRHRSVTAGPGASPADLAAAVTLCASDILTASRVAIALD